MSKRKPDVYLQDILDLKEYVEKILNTNNSGCGKHLFADYSAKPYKIL